MKRSGLVCWLVVTISVVPFGQLDAAAQPDVGAASDLGASDLSAQRPMCPLGLTLSSIDKTSTCFVDAPRRGSQTTTTYPCEGGGLSFKLGRHVFHGSVDNGSITARATSTFRFEDDCTWISEQAISGSLADGRLAYHYTERPDDGQSGCASSCRATGSVNVDYD